MVAALAASATLAACQDKRVKQLTIGITRDSAMSILAQHINGGGADSFPNVYVKAAYLINAQYLEVLYYTPNNEKAEKDTVAWAKLTPLTFYANRLVGIGWPAWDSASKANNIPLKDHK
jgi:beta-glucanase (GH16 family)